MNHLQRIMEVEVWKYVSIETLQQLCLTNKHNAQIFQNAAIWSFLLQRDFDDISDDAKQKYIEYVEILNYFTPTFPICTFDAIKMISDIIPRRLWDDICTHHKVPTFKVLSTYTIYSIFRNDRGYESNESDDSDLDTSDDDDDVNHWKLFLYKYENWLNIRYPNVFNKFFTMRDFKGSIAKNIPKFAQNPVKIYFKKKSLIVNINLDLVHTLFRNLHYGNKRDIYNQMENLLITEISH